MIYRFLDKEYNKEEYLKIKEKTKEFIDHEVVSVFTSSKNMEALAAKSGVTRPYKYIKGKMVFGIDQNNVSDVSNYITSTIIPEIRNNVQEDIFAYFKDQPTDIEFTQSEEDIENAKEEAAGTINPNDITVRIVPIDVKDIEIIKGAESPKVAYGKKQDPLDPDKTKEEAKFLPTYEIGVYYKGEMIQSENPNSSSGKTGFQSTRAKHAPRVENAIPAQRMYYRSGAKPSTLLYNAALLINNHLGLKYQVAYHETGDKWHILGTFKVKPASLREAHVYESDGKIYNYHSDKPVTINYSSVTKHAQSISRTDVIAWNYAYHNVPTTVKKHSTSHQLENTASQRADLNVKSEVFTNWIDSAISQAIKNKVEVYSVTTDPNTNTTSSTEVSII